MLFITRFQVSRIYSSLCQAENGWICESMGFKATSKGLLLIEKGFGERAHKVWDNVCKAANDDFNTPEILGEIFSLCAQLYTQLSPE